MAKISKELPEYGCQSRRIYGVVTGGTLFEELGFYIGPIDGHNLDHLLPVLRNLQKSKWDGPVFVHVVTKGYGYEPAENLKTNTME